MKRASGFTLVELLVVVAIISILAAIVVPNVAKYILRAQVARAEEEVHSIELALTSILSDTGVRDMRHMFTPGFDYQGWVASSQVYNDFYELLRTGRSATIVASFRPEVAQKLGTSYLADIGKDPWGSLYRVFPGPWRGTYGPMRYRSYRVGTVDPELNDGDPYQYTADAKTDADADVPGNPQADDLWGFPAPRDYTFYIWSVGPNMLDDQLNPPEAGADQSNPERIYWGGGDDINNWDSERGWSYFSG